MNRDLGVHLQGGFTDLDVKPRFEHPLGQYLAKGLSQWRAGCQKHLKQVTVTSFASEERSEDWL
jgi:hypothetical protein